MVYIPNPIELHNRFLDDVSNRSDKARAEGMDPFMVAQILLMLSREAAMKGGPVPLYQHSYMMEDEGKQLRKEFIERFGSKVDLDALIKGEIVHL